MLALAAYSVVRRGEVWVLPALAAAAMLKYAPALLVACAQTLSLTFFKQAYMLNYFAMVIVPAFVVFRQARGERAAGELRKRPLPTVPISPQRHRGTAKARP